MIRRIGDLSDHVSSDFVDWFGRVGTVCWSYSFGFLFCLLTLAIQTERPQSEVIEDLVRQQLTAVTEVVLDADGK